MNRHNVSFPDIIFYFCYFFSPALVIMTDRWQSERFAFAKYRILASSSFRKQSLTTRTFSLKCTGKVLRMKGINFDPYFDLISLFIAFLLTSFVLFSFTSKAYIYDNVHLLTYCIGLYPLMQEPLSILVSKYRIMLKKLRVYVPITYIIYVY